MDSTPHYQEADTRAPDEWESYLGQQIRKARIRTNFDQTQLAAKANISIGALKNLESGKGSSLKTLIKVVRALDRCDWLEALAPKISISPMQMLKHASLAGERQRVYRPRPAKISKD